MSDSESIPVADRVTARTATSKKASLVSRMWWVAAACLILAIGLTWAALDPPGRQITIRFDQGHGLASGDFIRHRGIVVGTIDAVRLLPDLSGIEVVAELEQHADQVARDGSRFWIVHPQLNLDGVRGLDTAIGAKYVGVLPGDGPKTQISFDGMSVAPPEGAEQDGIEVILRGEDRYGLSIGSPVTFRGVEVGRVLSSRLSPDAKHVDSTILIAAPHDRLVSTQTKFWKTSGIDIAVSLKGFEFSAQSLATVLRGGVAFATPGTFQGDDPSSVMSASGQVFELHEKANSQWLDSQAAINVLRQRIPPMVELRATWQEKQFGFTRSRSINAIGLVTMGSGRPELIFPSDLIEHHRTGLEGSFDLQVKFGDQSQSLANLIASQSAQEADAGLLTPLPLDPGTLKNWQSLSIAPQRIRKPEKIEDCFVVRSSSETGRAKSENSTTLLEMIGAEDLVEENGCWKSRSSTLSRDLWHGSPVLSAKDEKCIGMLVVTSGGVRIATW